MSIYPAWFQVIRTIVRPFFKRLHVEGAENLDSAQPCVFIVRHLNNYGPCAAYLFAPAEFHLWTYYTFMNRKTFYQHCSEFTFSKRAGMPLWLAKVCSTLLCWWVPHLFRKVGMIPVYRGLKDVLKTMELSVDALEKGENVLIMPDIHYVNEGGQVGEMYTGFVYLGKLYNKRTGKRLNFIPLCVNREQHILRVGRAIAYDPTRPSQEEKEHILAHLSEELNRI